MGSPRVTLPFLRILSVLLRDPGGRHYGLEVAREAGVATGTAYPVLARLEEEGWLVSCWEEIDPVAAGRRPRRYYRVTDGGVIAGRGVMAEVAGIVARAATSRG